MRSGLPRPCAALLALPFLALPLLAQRPAATLATPPAAPPDLHGRVEALPGGLTILRTWGTPAERGFAHGYLLGPEIAASLITEFTARFGSRKPLLVMARSGLDRLIDYPDEVRTELQALFDGMVARGADRTMQALGREFDLDDLLVANALDVFGMMGCSGFAVWGERVLGGGVLSGRNFDWPMTGPHLLDGTILLVQHRPDAPAVAAVTWPGFVAAVTGFSSEGVAAYLHVGSGRATALPEPESWPTAIAARAILEQLRAAAPPAACFATARELLANTSPPAGFLTHVVLPQHAPGGPPIGVFEADARSCVRDERSSDYSVVTNHFRWRSDGREPARDSLGRERQLCQGVDGCLGAGDEKVSVDEGWQLLRAVQRGGGRRFGTLHSLVFRHEPWHCELRIATATDGRIVAAPDSARRFVLTREQVFGAGDPAAK